MEIKEVKDMLLAIKEQIATVLSDNCKMKNDLLALKESMNAKDRKLTPTKEQLPENNLQNNSLKSELKSARNSKKILTTFGGVKIIWNSTRVKIH